MQPPPLPPEPPTAPTLPSPDLVPPALPAPVVGPVDVAPFTVTLPRNAEQVRGLRERASEIGNQLESARDQRNEIVEHLQGGAPEGRAGIERQLEVVDQRIVQLEQDLTATQRALTGASPELLSQVALQDERRQSQRAGNDEDEVGVAAFTAGVLLTLLATFVRRRFRRRVDARRQGVVPTGEDDPRYERLAQAVDAIAVEVERIGEGQRFVTQLLSQQDSRALSSRTADMLDGRR